MHEFVSAFSNYFGRLILIELCASVLQGWDSGTATPAANTGLGVKFGKSETSSGMALLLHSSSLALSTGRVLCGSFYFIFMCRIYFGLSGQGATQSRPLSAHIISSLCFVNVCQ